MDRQTKHNFVTGLHEEFKNASAVVVTHYKGLTVAEITELRRQSRAQGVTFRVAKNSLTKLALKGTAFEPIADKFTGPTAIAYANDPVTSAKIMVEFAKKNEKLVIIGGAIEQRVLAPSEVETLAKMPSLDVLRAQLLGLLAAPATRIARLLKEPGAQIARVTQAYASK